MSHFSLNLPSSDTLWYTPTSMDPHSQPFFYHPSSTLSLSTTKYDDVDSDISTTASNAAEPTSSSVTLDHEYMFEKPLTPSDVGKLNRLVIPKQHAEKYFPLSASSSTTTTATESSAGVGGGGVLLGFEDESGKCWKFRYSYWNSSQSYVLTKGWSRYVKEKKLDAGDVVLFQRHRFEPKRFFIGWRRRGSTPVQNNPVRTNPVQNYAYNNNNYNGAPQLHQMASFSSYRPEYLHSGTEVRQKGRKGGSGNSKRVRLFGVNLIQEEEEEDEEEEEMSQTNSDGSSLSSSQGQAQAAASGFPLGPTAYNYFDYVGVNYPPNNHHYTHMDMNFPQDVNQMSNRLR